MSTGLPSTDGASLSGRPAHTQSATTLLAFDAAFGEFGSKQFEAALRHSRIDGLRVHGSDYNARSITQIDADKKVSR